MPFVTYNLNIPNGPNNPSVDQPDMQTNTNSVNTLIGVDHISFNDNNGGYHNVIHFLNQGSDPVTVAGFGEEYTKTVSGDQQLFYKSGNGVVTQITNANGLNAILPRAAVNFQGRSTNGACTLNYQTNVASVTRTAKGFYTVSFTTPLPTPNYYPTVIGQPAASGSTMLGMLEGTQPLLTTDFDLRFADSSLNDQDPTVAIVLVFQ